MISVVIVNYNAGPLLATCVGAALAQADEVVVVDNAAADDSLARLALCFPAAPRLKVIRNPRNRGFAVASMTAMTVLSYSRVARDVLKSFIFGIGCSINQSIPATMMTLIPQPRSAGGIGS